jgi:benzoyl-CoA reductase/2-hydroxyglutaryl-CoA dehydratase subunit BcrC/BadD/HgdB
MKAVLYTSAYVPAEWIAAHGFQPVQLVPGDLAEIPPVLNREGVCPFLRAFVSEALAYPDAAAIVMTTTCDQMRRGFDIMARAGQTPAFLLNIPHTLQSPAARRLYVDELRRLGGFLTDLGGTPPSPEQLAELMLDHAHGCHVYARVDMPTSHSVPVALVGPSLRRQDMAISDIIQEYGGHVALDATETGERGRHRPFDRRAVKDDPLLELADAYLNGIVDVFARPNDSFCDWLVLRLKQRGIRAIILHRYLWCDLWHVECARLKARTRLPVLDLDVGGDASPAQTRMRSRIGAFMEMLT